MSIMRVTKLIIFSCFILSIFGNDALSALTLADVEKLNAGPLNQEQLGLVKRLNDLLKDSSTSTLTEVYDTWHQLKNTFPDNIKNVITDWENKRDELLVPVLDKLEDAAKETGNRTQQKIFRDFREASLSLSSGDNIPNITLWDYEILRQRAVNDLGNVSDVLMNIYTNLSHVSDFGTDESVNEWFTNLSSIGPAISSHYNETLDNLRTTISKWKSQLKDVKNNVKTVFQQFWNNTKITATNIKNSTKEWFHNEHPKVENALNNVKTAFNDVGKRISNTWNSFMNIFKPSDNSNFDESY